jgi:hypothetical protein
MTLLLLMFQDIVLRSSQTNALAQLAVLSYLVVLAWDLTPDRTGEGGSVYPVLAGTASIDVSKKPA